MVSVLHAFSGEFDFLVDHEGMRWARSLRPGVVVQIAADPPVKAVVRQVQAWRERTLVRLIASGSEQAELAVGQRRRLLMTAPPAAVDCSELPADVDLPRAAGERVDWLLASIYCVCLSGDTCTGHFTRWEAATNGCGTSIRGKSCLMIAAGGPVGKSSATYPPCRAEAAQTTFSCVATLLDCFGPFVFCIVAAACRLRQESTGDRPKSALLLALFRQRNGCATGDC